MNDKVGKTEWAIFIGLIAVFLGGCAYMVWTGQI